MNVEDRPHKRLHGEDVSIVTTTRLPEMALDLSVRMTHGQSLEPTSIRPPQKVHGLPRDRLLDRLQDLADIVLVSARTNSEMHVFGHEGITPDIEVVLSPGLTQGVYKPLTGAVFAEELVPVVAGKRQLVSMAGIVEAFAQVADRSVFHEHGDTL